MIHTRHIKRAKLGARAWRLCVATLLLFVVSVAANAYDFEAKNDDGVTIYYNVVSSTERTCEVTYGGTSYSSALYSGSVNIPETVNPSGGLFTYTVTSVGEYAFYHCSGLTSVTIPNSVTSIGINSFYNCSGLTSVIIGNSVTEICDGAFSLCSGLTGELSIPNSVTEIGKSAFNRCSGLTGVTIGNSVETIGNYAFQNCSGLTEVTFNATACTSADPSTSNGAFYGCDNIATFNFGDNVTIIPDYLCYGLTGLTCVTIPNSVTLIGSYAFYNCSGMTGTLTIPDGITTINIYTFSGCSGLTGITIPESVTEIGSSAFSGCSGLTGITIPNSVTEIGSQAFYKCTGLKEVTIGNSVTEISSSTFSGCSGLTEITIPNNVTTIGSGAFANCSGLKQITIPDGITEISSTTFTGCSGLTSITIPESVTKIGSQAFSGCSGLTSITIPENVTEISGYTFRNCSGLTSITIPNSVTSIGESAFVGCSALQEITIPNSVTTIDRHAFDGCTGLTKVTIGAGVETIGVYSFGECTGLAEVNFNATACTYAGAEYNSAFYGSTYISKVTIGDNVTIIPSYLFQSCTRLTEITIPESVTEIGKGVFSGTLLSMMYLYGRLDSYEDLFTKFKCDTIYAHSDQIEEMQKYWSGTLLPLEVDYTLSVVSIYPRSVALKVVANGGLASNATINRIEIGGQAVTADKDGLYVSTGLMPNTSYVCKLYYNSAGSDYTDEAVVTTKDFAAEMVLQKVTTQSVTFFITLNEDAYSSMPDEYGFMLDSAYYPADEDGTITITGLEQNTAYTFTPYAKYGDVVAQGESVTVTTQEFVALTVETYEAMDVTSESAILRGYVDAGTEDVLEQGFEYWGSDGKVETVTVSGSNISATINNLSEGATYTYRAYAKTERGTTYGGNMDFTTHIAPTVQTYEATDVTYNSAVLNGYVEAGDEEILECGFEYWTTAYDVQAVTSTGGNLSVAVANLKSNTKYTYRAYAKTASGTTYGEDMTFTTETIVPPTVLTYEATNVTENSALLSGYVEAGSEDVQVKGFEYWAEGGEIRASGMAIELPMELNLAGLDHGTTYTYRAYATTASGTTYGNEVTFTTLGTATITPPTVQTYAATEVTDISATLNGVITTGDEEILEHGFEYWSEGGEIQSITTRNLSMTVTLTGLMPNTNYTYRAYATTASGTTYGVEVTFTTLYDMTSVYAELEEAIEEMYDDLKAAWKTITSDYPDAEDDCMDYYDDIYDKVMDLLDMLDSNYRKGTLYDDVVEEIRSGIAEGERMIEEMLAAAKKEHETGIEDILANCGDDVRVYNLAGSRVHRFERGNVYIIRYSDGTAKKVLVK